MANKGEGELMETGSKRTRRTAVVVIASVVVSLLALGGVAIAMLGGAISGVNLATGLATGQAQPCQSNPVNFAFVAPKWNGSAKAFAIKEVSFDDVSSACVDAGARLYLVVSDGNTTFLDTVLVPTSSSGSVELDTPVNSNRAANVEINYLVEN